MTIIVFPTSVNIYPARPTIVIVSNNRVSSAFGQNIQRNWHTIINVLKDKVLQIIATMVFARQQNGGVARDVSLIDEVVHD